MAPWSAARSRSATRAEAVIDVAELADGPRPSPVTRPAALKRPHGPVPPGSAQDGYTAPMHTLIETHRAELLALARRRGVTGVRVFGSMSRGDGSDDSDVDLLVTLSPGTSALALGGLLLDAQELLGRRVDVVTEASLHPALRDRVVASAVPL